MGSNQFHNTNEIRIVRALYKKGEMSYVDLNRLLFGGTTNFQRIKAALDGLFDDCIIERRETISSKNGKKVYLYKITDEEYEKFMDSLLKPKGRFSE